MLHQEGIRLADELRQEGLPLRQLVGAAAQQQEARTSRSRRIGVISGVCPMESRNDAAFRQDRPGGSQSTWAIRSAPVASIASRSKPSAMPAAGGMPCSRAARKSSSSGQSGPYSACRRARSAGKRARCSTGSVSSTKALASSMPQTNSSNRSATRGSAGSRRASAACGAGQWVRKVGMRTAKPRLDPLQQQAEEQVLPGFALAQPGARRGGKGRGVLQRAQQVGAGIAGEGVGDGQPLDLAEVGGDAAAGDRRAAARRAGRAVVSAISASMPAPGGTIPAW